MYLIYITNTNCSLTVKVQFYSCSLTVKEHDQTVKEHVEMFLPCSLACSFTVEEHTRIVKKHPKIWDQNFKNAVFRNLPTAVKEHRLLLKNTDFLLNGC